MCDNVIVVPVLSHDKSTLSPTNCTFPGCLGNSSLIKHKEMDNFDNMSPEEVQ